MKAKGMAARFGAAAFGKVALVAAAICMAATSALADVTMPHIVSHRGESQDRPENTMAAFNAAIEQGYALIELDPKYTADGRFVILHDRTLKRTARDRDGNAPELAIADITYDEAKGYECLS